MQDALHFYKRDEFQSSGIVLVKLCEGHSGSYIPALKLHNMHKIINVLA